MIGENRKQILIVEDDETISSVLRMRLKSSGYDLFQARNGEEALALLENELPDLILLDLMMPTMGGWETCRRIRQNERTKKIPIFIVSALRSENDKQQAKLYGANEIFVKPVDLDSLLKKIRSYLGSPFK